ncbi:hypothetical protein SAMN05660657_03319 [Geodermatophilus amargosae]|uniref:Uncharacterized protein n=1 Tax=Geodermatophilus amargosae TaxID=1296565 RepID=A0A1I7B5T8_9ACTN|nr:hypothetical protein [Geodermatophilus amargosae]SFT82589.1 hypothetical protein SAMN05660657_03319 [Geodermatophilus amargosae]
MDAIDPSRLTAQHLDRPVELRWEMTVGNQVHRATVRGILLRIRHDEFGATVTVKVGPHLIEANPHNDPAEVWV